ncbi:glycosyltransferase [Herbiconiux sp. UC225_62]|uniref:glycosyltransferase n=1 Tax=Herbiconiux sp. UC225_62 TaxID=3350168 RepID=UPI0036D246F5
MSSDLSSFLGDVSTSLLWLLPFGVFGIVSWSFWLIRKLISASTKPVVNDYRTTTTVVVPSYHEDPAVLLRCLETWRRQGPSRIVIVLDVADTEAQQLIEERGYPEVDVIMFKHRGKRSALGVGIRAATPSSSCSSTPTPGGRRGCSTPSRCPSSTPPSAR